MRGHTPLLITEGRDGLTPLHRHGTTRGSPGKMPSREASFHKSFVSARVNLSGNRTNANGVNVCGLGETCVRAGMFTCTPSDLI